MYKDRPLPNQSKLPLVSICIPAFNAEATLSETLESVLAQDYPKLDVVVSDNQSTDSTKAIVERYAQCGVRYCRHPQGHPATMPDYRGVFANWDFALAQGHGDYLCLFHSDDLYEPSIVKKQIEVMQAYPNVGAVFTRMRMIGEDSRPIRMGESELPDEFRGCKKVDFPTLLNLVLAHGNFLSTPSVMLRRSMLYFVGRFDERRFLTAADFELWLRIALKGYEIAIIDQPLVKCRVSRRHLTAQYNKLRTTLADGFGVLDHYLGRPEIQQFVSPHSNALYEPRRAVDQVLCAMSLLTQERAAEARRLVDQAMRARYFITAFRSPRTLAGLMVGAAFWIGLRLGLGVVFGRSVYRAYQCDSQRQREPLG